MSKNTKPVNVAESYKLYLDRKRASIRKNCEKRLSNPDFLKVRAKANGYFDLASMQRAYPTFRHEPVVVVNGQNLDPLCETYRKSVFAKAMDKGKKRANASA